jgi:hypothetical protein
MKIRAKSFFIDETDKLLFTFVAGFCSGITLMLIIALAIMKLGNLW